MRFRPFVAAAALVLALSLTFVGVAAAEAPQINTPATITGTAAVGQQLTAHNGTWLYADGTSCQSECVMTYQWQRCTGGCADIGGATGRFYTVQAADAGHTLLAMETMTKYDCGAWNYAAGTQECRYVSKSAPSGMTSAVPGSAPTTPTAPAPSPPPSGPPPQWLPLVAPSATAAPTISGLAMVDHKLTMTRGAWSGTQPLSLLVQWQRCDANGQHCRDVGLSGDDYTVIAFDIGQTLRVRVTAVNAAGASEAFSSASPVVSELKPTAENQTLPAAKVAAPHKLVLDQAAPAPERLARRGRVELTLRVSDTRGFLIHGALVTAVVLPSKALLLRAQAESDDQGLVTLTFTRGPKLKLRTLKFVTIVVTARRPGDRMTSPRASVMRIKIAVRAAATPRKG